MFLLSCCQAIGPLLVADEEQHLWTSALALVLCFRFLSARVRILLLLCTWDHDGEGKSVPQQHEYACVPSWFSLPSLVDEAG